MKEQEKSPKELVKETGPISNSEKVLLSKMEAMETRILSEVKSRRG